MLVTTCIQHIDLHVERGADYFDCETAREKLNAFFISIKRFIRRVLRRALHAF